MIKGTGYFIAIVVLLIPSTACNVTLLHFLTKRSELNTVPNKYLTSILRANLIAGLIVAVACLVVIFTKEVAQNYLFCFAITFMDRSFLAVTTWSMSALSFERYKYHVRLKNNSFLGTKKTLIIIWISSCGYGLLCLVVGFFLEQTSMPVGEVEGMCSLGHYTKLTGIVIHILDFIALFLVPTCVMGVSYYRIIKKLWCAPCASLVQQKLKRKATLMNIAISVLHMLAWAPLCGFKIFFAFLQPITDDDTNEKQIQFSSLLLDCLRFLVVPVVYFSFSQQAKLELSVQRANRVQPETATRRKTLDDLDKTPPRRYSSASVQDISTSKKQRSNIQMYIV